MNTMLHILNTIKRPYLLVAFVHWYASFFWERGFYAVSMLEKPGYAITKLLFLACLWQIVAYMIRRYKEDATYRQYIHYVGGYFIFLLLLLLLAWPGSWVNDELLVLRNVLNLHPLKWHGWQHILTSVFYQLALFIIPTPSIIVIFQICCLSLIFGYFITVVETYTNQSKLTYFAFIPFLFPPVLLHNIQPIRATLFAYLLLFLLTKILDLRWSKKNISYPTIIYLAVIAAIITNFRGEGIGYIVLAPLIFVVALWRSTSRSKKILFISIVLIGASAISIMQNTNLGDRKKQAYLLTAYVTPLRALVIEAKNNNREDLLVDIRQSLNIDIFDTKGAVVAFWEDTFIKEEFYNGGSQKTLRAYFKLMRTYPLVWINERWNHAIKTYRPWVRHSHFKYPVIYEALFKNKFSDFLNFSTREKTLERIALLKSERRKFWPYVYGGIPPFCLIIILSLSLLIKRHYAEALTVSSLLSLTALVVLTSPETLFMYYFSFYFCGYAFSFAALIFVFTQLLNKKQYRNEYNASL